MNGNAPVENPLLIDTLVAYFLIVFVSAVCNRTATSIGVVFFPKTVHLPIPVFTSSKELPVFPITLPQTLFVPVLVVRTLTIQLSAVVKQ